MYANVDNALRVFTEYVEQKSKSNLDTLKKNASGNLKKSIKGTYKVSKNSFQLNFEMEDYGTFQDLGVKGTKSSQKAPNSPYKMGTGSAPKGLFKTAINAWVVRKGIAPREGGRFTARKNLNYLIRKSIYETGLKTTNFFTEPFETAFKDLPEEIVEAYGLDIEGLLKISIKNGKQQN
jgi:hypothetical protein